MGQGLCFSSHLIPPQLNSLALCEFLLPPITDFIYSNFDICTVIRTPQAVGRRRHRRRALCPRSAVRRPLLSSLIRAGGRGRVGHPV